MLFTASKAALALLCLLGSSSAFSLPVVFEKREDAICIHAKEGASCTGLPADLNWGCSMNMWDIVSRIPLPTT